MAAHFRIYKKKEIRLVPQKNYYLAIDFISLPQKVQSGNKPAN